MILKYRESDPKTLGTLSPAYEVIEFLPLAIMQLSLLPCFFCKVICLPDFEPNEYLFETHKDKGSERWEIYAWAIRDIMMKQGGLEECNYSWKHKDQYERYMRMTMGAEIPEYAPGGVPVPIQA